MPTPKVLVALDPLAPPDEPRIEVGKHAGIR